jgi:hypothetical protein
MSKHTTSKRRVNQKEITFEVSLLRVLARVFVANDYVSCIRILNYGDGRHSLASKYIEVTYMALTGRELPEWWGKAWDNHKLGFKVEEVDPILHECIGQGRIVSRIVSLVRATLALADNSSLTLSERKFVLDTIIRGAKSIEKITG